MAKAELWRNRIVGSAEVAPDSLLAHPSNWRGHPANQQNALTDILGGDDGVGWLDTVMVNKRTSELWPEGDRNVETVVDGHLRVALAMRHNQPTVPVRYVDLTPAEEALALATFDPIGALATAQAEQLDAVLREVQTGSAAVQEMLANLVEDEQDVLDEKGSKTLLDQAVQLRPARQYVMVVCGSDSEWDRLRDLFGLKESRRGGYKEGSPFDDVGTNRVVEATQVLRLADAHSDTE